jgi:hypothetical protein
MNRHTVRSRYFLTGLLALIGAAHAETLERATIDNGGGRSSAGPYVVFGTAGQPDVGTASGGAYRLRGGFWMELVPPSDALFGDGFE